MLASYHSLNASEKSWVKGFFMTPVCAFGTTLSCAIVYGVIFGLLLGGYVGSTCLLAVNIVTYFVFTLVMKLVQDTLPEEIVELAGDVQVRADKADDVIRYCRITYWMGMTFAMGLSLATVYAMYVVGEPFLAETANAVVRAFLCFYPITCLAFCTNEVFVWKRGERVFKRYRGLENTL